ncbi:PREDICTED: zinc finger FYVE domain-containing protein 26 homolog isoform X1 [Nicrophorus vespilloides]|uniref:Zinc finger FYVE domain-containing protein 26 homolog isoform X1 n=2 Tax=Nicrophorus vespilloides TaxID=110193 RepID=A0ABM1M0U1_NICVS|nr:PREDICTED: zinc finger FYVE domain-containing protein 26 homolog isoform X1 [Nicrophorus vespilloides]
MDVLRELSSRNDVYTVFPNLRLENDQDLLQFKTILPQIYNLIDKGILQKELLYLSLLINPNEKILETFIDYEVSLPLDLSNSTSLFFYAFYKRKYWFSEILNNTQSTDRFDNEIKNNIQILKLMKVTNEFPIDCRQIVTALESIEPSKDEFITTYLDEIQNMLNVIIFCRSLNPSIDETNLFNTFNESSLLTTFSQYLPLEDSSTWDKVASQLEIDENRKTKFVCNLETDDEYSEIENFTAYTIILNILKCINLCKTTTPRDDISEIVRTSEERFLKISNLKLQIEVLENVFSMCFLRDNNIYVCNEKELYMILIFVKSAIGKIKQKLIVDYENEEYVRWNKLYKYVRDGLWRLETVINVKNCGNKEIINYMLSKPEGLIRLCLKKNNFKEAHQVIQLFELQKSDLAQSIFYTEQLNNFRVNLSTAFKMQELQRALPHLRTNQISVEKITKTFFDKAKSNSFYDLFDIALTFPSNRDHCEQMLRVARHFDEDNDDDEFYERISELFEFLDGDEDISFNEILCNPEYELRLESYRAKLETHSKLNDFLNDFFNQIDSKEVGCFNSNHPAHRTFMRINELISDKNSTKYVLRLFNYLKLFLKIFQVEENHADLVSGGRNVSYFEILNQSCTEFVGKLIFVRKLDPLDFDQIFGKLKLDLVYHVASNCFPKVRMNYEETQGEQTWAYIPAKQVFTYIQKRNWLLAFIIGQNYMLDFAMEVNENRTMYFNNFVNLEDIKQLSVLFGNNRIQAALRKDLVKAFVEYLDKNVYDDKDDSFETAEEILEEDVKFKWKSLLDVLESIPEIQLRNWAEYENTKNIILSNLVVDKFEEGHFKYIQYVTDDELRVDLIMNHFSYWPGDFCVSLIRSELSKSTNHDLKEWLDRIEFSESIKAVLDEENWFETHKLCISDPSLVISKLLLAPKTKYLLDYVRIYAISRDVYEQHINLSYIQLMFSFKEPLDEIESLLSLLRRDSSVEICQYLLKTVKNLDHLQFIINYLLKRLPDASNIRDIQISLEILRCLNPNEQEQMRCLIGEPLNIIETLVMNTKLDKLGQVMEALQDKLKFCELADNQISIETIDDLLRKYAEKSLEFRVILQPHPKLLKSCDSKLMQSLDSMYWPDRKPFVMPDDVPDKSDWMPNNEVLECMCCQNTIFSMFNRRHHCRRCGRVICFNCSTKRMNVHKYGDIMVRVCIDCYEQSNAEDYSSNDTTSCRSIMYDYWFLTDNPDHNAILRQEFSFEHAPSVSLCLSIMKHHSRCLEYPKFLLDQCENMLKLLQPTSPNAPQEVDYSLVVKMLKSLAIAAKMVSSDCNLQWGSSQADRILSQADLLGLLAERGCLNLLPIPSHNGTPYVDSTVLRRLRDKLLEMEQWNFALDVSTKAGLDNTAVFAEWGKSYLRAGCLEMARENFSRCFEKSHPHEFLDYSMSIDLDENSVDSSIRKHYHSKSSLIMTETKPQRNPPLLNKIIEILENQTMKVDVNKRKTFNSTDKLEKSTTYRKHHESEQAICIKYKLRNLKMISTGLYMKNSINGSNHIDPIFYNECLYYLNRYGSHLSLLQFYIKNNNVHEALHYIVDNSVSTDVFIDVYLICLKDGIVQQLQSGMSTIDSTLEIWKDYLRSICCHLEKQSLLNSLYQLQQFMGDFVRASMTCIRFYKENAKSYRDLLLNVHFLDKAKDHLRQELEQQQWVKVNPVKKQNCYEEKALANPSLVMKVDSKNINKHINTIKNQIIITNFLANGFKDEKYMINILPNLVTSTEGEGPEDQIPTLFDSHSAKIQLAILTILSRELVEEGFEYADKIITDFKLKPIKVYCQVGRQLAREERYEGIAQLVNCIRSKGENDPSVIDMCDEMLATAVRTLGSNKATSTSQLEMLIKLITDRNIKISMYIETKQLKSAYLLAAKYNRSGDLRRIMREAELLNKPDIKKLCQKLLQTHSHSHKDT